MSSSKLIKQNELLEELVLLVETAKSNVVSYANSSLTILFWQIGNRVNTNLLNNTRAEYGKEIVVTMSRELVLRYGKSYEEKNLRRMIQFAEKYSDFENVVTLSRHLSWSHFLTLIPVKRKRQDPFMRKW